MTVSDLKEKLSTYDDSAEVFYFDSEAGEDAPMISSWITIKEQS